MGGLSSEREVSLLSGEECARALERLSYRVTRIDPDQDLAAKLIEIRPDVVLNMLHGGHGGNGVIQGTLEMMGLPYTHSGVRAAALATHKGDARTILNDAGIRVPFGMVVPRREASRVHLIKPPYVAKPLCEGSSLGIAFVMDGDDPVEFLGSDDWTYGPSVLLEEYIPGKELSCAVLGDRALAVVETIPVGKFNDHAEKSAIEGSVTIVPANLPANVYQLVQQAALGAHSALGCRGASRSDFRYNEQLGAEGIFCLEVNNQPGMTKLSLLPEMAQYEGIEYDELVRWILSDASINR